MGDDAPEFDGIRIHSVRRTPVAELRPHPKNYRTHPQDQIEQLVASLREHGFYRNVVTARDGTILAGHGVLEAATTIGVAEIPDIRLDVDPDDPAALRVLAGDNELPKLAQVDDRALSELLQGLRERDPIDGLLGTGFDDQMLSNLVFVTRPASEIRTIDEAAAWVGMPEFPESDAGIKLVVQFETEDDRAKLIETLGVGVSKKMRQTWSAWWPPRDREDLSSLRFEATPDPAEASGV